MNDMFSPHAGRMSAPASPDAGLAEAIRACGSRPALARKMGISAYTVAAWHRVPHSWLAAVSQAMGIPAEVLRPDVFLSPESMAVG